MKTGKGMKEGSMSTEIFKALPFATKLDYIKAFRNYFSDLKRAPCAEWRVAEFMSVPKENPVGKVSHLRWVGKTEVSQKWYLGTVMALIRPNIVGGNILSYGFRKGCTINEVFGAVLELLRSGDVWDAWKKD